jgi:hypothetical protein
MRAEQGTAEVTVVVEVLVTDITDDMTICLGDVVDLEATGGSDVIWTPTVGLGSPSSQSTTASPAESYDVYGVDFESQMIAWLKKK